MTSSTPDTSPHIMIQNEGEGSEPEQENMERQERETEQEDDGGSDDTDKDIVFNENSNSVCPIMYVLEDDDAGDDDPGDGGAGIAIPKDVPVEPGFLSCFANRFTQLLEDNNPNLSEVESITQDFIITVKKELNFKTRPDDGTVRPPKPINTDDAREIQKIYRKNHRKALRAIYNE